MTRNEKLMQPLLYKKVEEEGGRHWWYVGRRSIVDVLLLPYLNNKRKCEVLSVGCGTGEEIAFLSKYGHVTGIDPSEDAVNYCLNRKLPALIVRAEAEKLPFVDDSFDLVVALDVIEHIEDVTRAMAEIKRVLKPGGLALITVPAFNFLWNKSDVRAHHKRRFTKDALRMLVNGSGFQILRSTYFNFFLFPVIAGVKLALKVWEPQIFSYSEVTTPRPLLNKTLLRIFSLEARVLKNTDLPIGISIGAVLKK